MEDLFEYILAAGRKKPNDFSWIIPIILVVFYGLAALARVFNKSKEEQPAKPKKRELTPEDHQTSQRWQEKAMHKQQHRETKLQRDELRHQQQYTDRRYIETHDIEPEPSPVQTEKKTILKSMMEEVYRQATGEIPKPVRKTVSPKPVRKEPVMKPAVKRKPARIEEKPKEIIIEAQTHGLARLEGLDELKKAIVYAEILGKPKALRDI